MDASVARQERESFAKPDPHTSLFLWIRCRKKSLAVDGATNDKIVMPLIRSCRSFADGYCRRRQPPEASVVVKRSNTPSERWYQKQT